MSALQPFAPPHSTADQTARRSTWATASASNARKLLCSAALRGDSQNSNRLQLLPATLEQNHVLQDGVQVGPQGISYVVFFPNRAHYCDEALSMRLQQCDLSIQLTHDTNTRAKAKQKRTLLRAVPPFSYRFSGLGVDRAIGAVTLLNIAVFDMVDSKFRELWMKSCLEIYWPLWSVFFAPGAISALLATWLSRVAKQTNIGNCPVEMLP